MIDFSWRPPVDQRLPANAPFFYALSKVRSALDLAKCAQQFQLEVAKRYTRGLLNGQPSPLARSWCNLAVADITEAAGCPIPRSIKGKYLNANEQFDWLVIAGATEGWERVSLERAITEVERGLIVVPAWKNPDPKESGHIAVGQPAPHRPDGQLWIAQAGYRNFTCGTLGSGFGRKAPTIWLHA